MSTYRYQEVFKEVVNQARLLSPDDQDRLVKELEAFVRQQRKSQALHSIMELRGLGKEIWEGVDVEKYINEERDSCSARKSGNG